MSYEPIKTETIKVDGFEATVLIPANANGKWIWKTEFLYAFDEVEKELLRQGYTRIYYCISDQYGSPKAVERMYDCYIELRRRYDLDEQGIFAGFSRGAMYAFNFAMEHPECVSHVYLDAPLLDLRFWPSEKHADLHPGMMQAYGFESEEAYRNYDRYPVDILPDYFALRIPTLVVTGTKDAALDWTQHAGKMIGYAKENGFDLTYYIKLNENHHPHSFGTVGGTNMFGTINPETFMVTSSKYPGSDVHPVEVKNAVSEVIDFFLK